MSANARNDKTPSSEDLTPEEVSVAKAAGAWVGLLSRTIKNCRLYDSITNPVIQRLRADLAIGLQRSLDEHGTIALRFTSDDILCEGVSLYPARSREDNLALPFYRDGIRGLTFSPGVQPRELEAVVDAIIQVTGQNATEDDLVTLLWQAQLTHVEVEYVPADTQLASDGPIPDGAQVVPWPTSASSMWEVTLSSAVAASAPAAAPKPAPAPSGGAKPAGERSDDWQVSGDPGELEAGFDELATMAEPELERFRARLEAEHQISPVSAAILAARAYLAAGEPEDRTDLARFLPRVLRLAVASGAWPEADQTLTLLDRCESTEWSTEAFAEELCQPSLVTGIVSHLERQEPAGVVEFLAFACRLGEWTVDLLGLVLTERENPRHKRELIEAITEECRTDPERLAPWLADPRASVVRNTVQILGAIGGNAIAGMLGAVALHEDSGVRLAVLAALRRVEPALARPVVIEMLKGADTTMFCAILHQLGREPDPEVARLMLGYLTHPDFERQPDEERRAVYATTAAVASDEILPELEAELHKITWFSGGNAPHRQAVAECIAQIGTPRAREVLERAARSLRGPVRTTCEELLARLGTP